MTTAKDPLTGLLRTLANRQDILAKVEIELVGDEDRCRKIIDGFAALRGDTPSNTGYVNGQYCYGTYDSHKKISLVLYSDPERSTS